MSAIQSTRFLVRIGDGKAPTSFTTIGGQRGGRFSLRPADGNHAEIEISGIVSCTQAEARVAAAASNPVVNDFQVQVGNGDVWQGPFLVTEYDVFNAPDQWDGALQYRLKLESAGSVTLVSQS